MDGSSLAGCSSIRLHSGRDFVCSESNSFLRWTEVFLLKRGRAEDYTDSSDPMALASVLAKAICSGMVGSLPNLKATGVSKLAVRVKLDPENVRTKSSIIFWEGKK